MRQVESQALEKMRNHAYLFQSFQDYLGASPSRGSHDDMRKRKGRGLFSGNVYFDADGKIDTSVKESSVVREPVEVAKNTVAVPKANHPSKPNITPDPKPDAEFQALLDEFT